MPKGQWRWQWQCQSDRHCSIGAIAIAPLASVRKAGARVVRHMHPAAQRAVLAVAAREEPLAVALQLAQERRGNS